MLIGFLLGVITGIIIMSVILAWQGSMDGFGTSKGKD